MSLPRRILKAVYEETTRIGDELGLLSPDTIYRESWYADMASDDQLQKDAATVARVLADEFRPDSVIDLGCGVGHYLDAFAANENVETIHGVEGAKKALPHLQVSQTDVEIFDLRERYHPSSDYDLAICFEVAEHLPESSAETLVHSATACAPVVVFTAATPEQGGTHHVNEQPREYWINLFDNFGYEYKPEQTEELSSSMTVETATWIPENLFVFRKRQ